MAAKTPIYISIVIPVYNESECLPELYSRLVTVLEKQRKPFEIIFVNDNSTDSSLLFLKQTAQKDHRVKILNLSRNFGQQVAISAGLEHASGKAVIVMDADLQDPPEIIPDLIARWEEGNEVVNAVRKDRKEGFLKRSAYFIFYRLIERISDIHIVPDSGDFSLMDSKVVDILNSMPERNRFIRGLRGWVGFKQTELEYKRSRRFAGKTKYPYIKLLKLAVDGFVSFSKIPLRMASVLGIVLSLSSFLYIIYLLFMKLVFGIPLQGWTSTIVCIVFFGGTQFIISGIMGEYIARIVDDTKKRPLYILNEKINFE
jgi:dolichol-phosphate mannosyltransferase